MLRQLTFGWYFTLLFLTFFMPLCFGISLEIVCGLILFCLIQSVWGREESGVCVCRALEGLYSTS